MSLKSYQYLLEGVVQGLGIRPYIYQLAVQNHLAGQVNNTADGVNIQVTGTQHNINAFTRDLIQSNHLAIKSQTITPLKKDKHFCIAQSTGTCAIKAIVSPDLATCQPCLDEIFDKTSRRCGYALNSCSQCGPRYSIVNKLPYDRAVTSMAPFQLCDHCQDEYLDSKNRRFHAQTQACPTCGPTLSFLDSDGNLIANSAPLDQAICLLQKGHIVAIKGVGGYHLVANPRFKSSINKLRQIKSRPEKPFALMLKNLNQASFYCQLNDEEKKILLSPLAPILIAKKRVKNYYKNIAPNLNHLGIMLPYSGLHHLLMEAFDEGLVMTSANLNKEPLYNTHQDVLKAFKHDIAGILTHNRAIMNPVDDSIVKQIGSEIRFIRRARGAIPYQLSMETKNIRVLSLGAHLKNTICYANDNGLLLSTYHGDLESCKSIERLKKSSQTMMTLEKPDVVAHDAHPEYESTKLAQTFVGDKLRIQHHKAHIYAAIAEYNLKDTVLGFAWDGLGYGDDGTLWGGEAFIGQNDNLKRIQTFKSFKLPGSFQAIKQPYRVALSLLYETFGERSLDYIPKGLWQNEPTKHIVQMLAKNTNTPLCSSVGRLFDGIAALLGLVTKISYEGQAAIALEDIAVKQLQGYSIGYHHQNGFIEIDWTTMIHEIIFDLPNVSKSVIAGKFHTTLAQMITCVAKIMHVDDIILSGGVFQNHLLCTIAIEMLESQGFNAYIPKQIPMNDSGISVGQSYAALCNIKSNIREQAPCV